MECPDEHPGAGLDIGVVGYSGDSLLCLEVADDDAGEGREVRYAVGGELDADSLEHPRAAHRRGSDAKVAGTDNSPGEFDEDVGDGSGAGVGDDGASRVDCVAEHRSRK